MAIDEDQKNWDGNERRIIPHDYCTKTKEISEIYTNLAVLLNKFNMEYGDGYRKGNLYNSIDGIGTNISKIEKHLEKQNGRIRKLEDWKAFMTGSIAVISFVLVCVIAPAIVNFFSFLFKNL